MQKIKLNYINDLMIINEITDKTKEKVKFEINNKQFITDLRKVHIEDLNRYSKYQDNLGIFTELSNLFYTLKLKTELKIGSISRIFTYNLSNIETLEDYKKIYYKTGKTSLSARVKLNGKNWLTFEDYELLAENGRTEEELDLLINEAFNCYKKGFYENINLKVKHKALYTEKGDLILELLDFKLHLENLIFNKTFEGFMNELILKSQLISTYKNLNFYTIPCLDSIFGADILVTNKKQNLTLGIQVKSDKYIKQNNYNINRRDTTRETRFKNTFIFSYYDFVYGSDILKPYNNKVKVLLDELNNQN